MNKLIFLCLLTIAITGYKKAIPHTDKSFGKKKSSYIILKMNGQDYGKFGFKDDVPFLNKEKGKSSATISLGSNGFALTIFDGDGIFTKGTIMNLYLKNVTGLGANGFEGLTISGYDGSGTNFSYRSGEGDTKMFYYTTDEKAIRKPQGEKSCKTEHSGILGKTEAIVKQFTRNGSNPNGLIEGTFTARLFGHSVKEADDCQSDREMNISGYFYLNN